jgi:hypothetical protein
MTANILDENILDDRPLTRATRERATKRHYLPTDREGGAKKKKQYLPDAHHILGFADERSRHEIHSLTKGMTHDQEGAHDNDGTH